MRRKNLSNCLIVSLFVVVFTSCSFSNQTVRLEDIESGLNCIAYEEGMKWKLIQETFGEPDCAPVPSGDSLSKNARIYKDKIVIFHSELKKIKVEGKTRYEEVITKFEICETK